MEMFYELLPMKRGLFKVNRTDFNHVDFIWAIDAPTLAYNKVLELLASYLKGENN